jgi:nitroreductase
MTVRKPASTTAPLHPLLAERWSPRGFDPAHAPAEHEIVALLEAARWAPSANNSQPWRFLVATRDDEAFGPLLETLAPGNRAWAHAAGALILVAAQGTDDSGQRRRWAQYDTGQAVAALSLQAEAQGLRVHQMGGFNAQRTRTEFDLDESLELLVVVAVGRHDPDAHLPEQLAARETAPRSREPLGSLLLRPLAEQARHVA